MLSQADQSNPSSNQAAKYSFEEYKLYHETAERVTERRLSNNRWCYSICSAILLAMGFAWSWVITNQTYFIIVVSMIMVVSIACIWFCNLWRAQISDYKLLNKVKFQVLSEMSKNISFDPNSSKIISFDPFEQEWIKIKQELKKRKDNQLKSENYVVRFKKRIYTLSSSNAEVFLPNTFIFIFSIMFVLGIILIYLKYIALFI